MDLLLDLFTVKVAYASFDSFLANVNKMIINPLILFLFALAIVFFLYGMLEFIMHQESEEGKTDGRNHMIWGIIGLTIMFGVWSIMNLILNTFNITGINPEQNTVNLPKAPN